MESMERVLALQSLTTTAPIDAGAADSDNSNICSSESNGTGGSSCSIKCGTEEGQLEW